MIITLNGKEETIQCRTTLAGLIKQMNLTPEAVVIEHNKVIVPKEKWADSKITQNDSIEIISFVGGG